MVETDGSVKESGSLSAMWDSKRESGAGGGRGKKIFRNSEEDIDPVVSRPSGHPAPRQPSLLPSPSTVATKRRWSGGQTTFGKKRGKEGKMTSHCRPKRTNGTRRGGEESIEEKGSRMSVMDNFFRLRW